MADAPDPLTDEFAPPAAEPAAQGDPRRALRFLSRRGLRLLISPIVLATCSVLVLGRLDWSTIAAVWAIGVALWLPPTAIAARVEFYPSPPDRGLRDDQGHPTSERDQRQLLRSVVAEHLLGSLPALLLALWVPFGLDLPYGAGLGAGLALGGMILFGDARTTAGWWMREATLDLLVATPERARRRLEPFSSAPLGGYHDWYWHLLSLARFRTGDVDAALQALDRIRDQEAWQTEALRAQMAVSRGALDEAEQVAARLEADPDQAQLGRTLRALVDLHRGQGERVAAAADRLLAEADDDSRSTLALLVAAALAPTDRGRARRLLAEHRWDPERIRQLAGTWPAVYAPLKELDAEAAPTLR